MGSEEISKQDFDALRAILRDLVERVDRLEKLVPDQSARSAVNSVSSIPPAVPSQLSAAVSSHVETPAAPPHMATNVVPPPPRIYPYNPHAAAKPASTGDLESRIGSHWLNRIGIAAVLVGVSYFLKFAFENNWIGPTGRVAIGLLAGIGVVVWSEQFRKRGYAVFSYSLKAVGTGVLYLSLWAAFHVYALIPSGVAFTAMLLVTASTVAMALSQNAEILAAFALVGAFATPVLLSTGENKELALFSYVALLDFGTLAMIIFRSWQRLLLLSYIGTISLYCGWYSTFYDRPDLNSTLAFASLFFAIFAIAPLVSRRPPEGNAPLGFLALALAFVNAGVYFLQAYLMIHQIDPTTMAWFALGLAAVYVVLSRLTGAKYGDPESLRKLRLLHLALAAGFITVAIPIRLNEHWITIGWFVEAALLLWVANRIRSELLNAFALLALVLGVVRLLAFDDFYSTQLLFNARMATYLVAIVVLAILAWYASQRDDDTAEVIGAMAIIALNALALVALSREVNDYYRQRLSNLNDFYVRTSTFDGGFRAIQIARDFTYSALWMAYGAMLMIIGFWRRSAFVRWQALVLIAITTVKVFVYDVSQLDHIYRVVSFIALGVMLLAVSFVYQRDWLQLSKKANSQPESQPQS